MVTIYINERAIDCAAHLLCVNVPGAVYYFIVRSSQKLSYMVLLLVLGIIYLLLECHSRRHARAGVRRLYGGPNQGAGHLGAKERLA